MRHALRISLTNIETIHSTTVAMRLTSALNLRPQISKSKRFLERQTAVSADNH